HRAGEERSTDRPIDAERRALRGRDRGDLPARDRTQPANDCALQAIRLREIARQLLAGPGAEQARIAASARERAGGGFELRVGYGVDRAVDEGADAGAR